MCKAASFVLTKDKVFFSLKSDSHEEIILENGLHEDGANGPNILRVEVVPTVWEPPCASWKYSVDQDILPKWSNPAEDERRARAALLDWWKGHKNGTEFSGSLDLSSLTSIGEGVTLTAGGSLDLRSLTSIGEGVTLKAGGHLYLRSITSLHDGVTLTAGGSLDLRSLTSIGEGVTIKAGGDLYLRSITSLPDGVTLTAGGDLYLRYLTSIGNGVTLKAGGDLDIFHMTSIGHCVKLESKHVYWNGGTNA